MTAIPTRSVSMPANGLAHWIHYNSPTTQIIGSDGNNFRQRVVCWDTAGGAPSAYYSGKTTYCIFGYRMVTGSPGRFLDWHNMADDQPWGWTPPNCPTCARTGVSPIAIDCWGDSRGTHFVLQADKDSPSNGTAFHTIFTQAQTDARRGSWVYLWIRIDWGRSDTLPDGRLRVWVAGEDNSPRIDAQNVNTFFWQQHMLTCFQGTYWSSSNNPSITVEHTAMRFGRTPQECYLDVPVYHADSTYSPPGSSTPITARQHDEVAIPTDLDWGAGDTTAPVLQSAAILGNGSSLVYNEALDPTSEPATSDYTYLVNGVSRAVTSTNVVADRVDNFLVSPVVNGDTVTVSYTRVGGRELKDTAGNLAANLSGQAVSNNTPPAPNPNRTTVTRATSIARVSDVGARIGGLGGGGI